MILLTNFLLFTIKDYFNIYINFLSYRLVLEINNLSSTSISSQNKSNAATLDFRKVVLPGINNNNSNGSLSSRGNIKPSKILGTLLGAAGELIRQGITGLNTNNNCTASTFLHLIKAVGFLKSETDSIVIVNKPRDFSVIASTVAPRLRNSSADYESVKRQQFADDSIETDTTVTISQDDDILDSVMKLSIYSESLPEQQHVAMVREISDLYETLESILTFSHPNDNDGEVEQVNRHFEMNQVSSSMATFGV